MSAENSLDLYRTEPGSLAGRYLRSFWQPVYRASLKAYTDDGTLFPGAQERIISFHKREVKIDKDVSAQRIFNFSLLQSILSDKGKN